MQANVILLIVIVEAIQLVCRSLFTFSPPKRR